MGKITDGFVEIFAETRSAFAGIRSVTDAMRRLPDGEVDVTADTDDAQRGIRSVADAAARMPDAQVDIVADAASALGGLRTVADAAGRIPDAVVDVTADTSDAIGGLRSVSDAASRVPDVEVAVKTSGTEEARTGLGGVAGGVAAVSREAGTGALAMGGLAGGMSGMRAAGAGLLGLGIVGWLHDAAVSSLEVKDAVNATNVVFGQSAPIINKHAEDSVRGAGLSEGAYRQMAAALGGALKSQLGDQKAAADLTVESIRIGADFASVYGGSVAEAVGAVSSAFRGERDPIEKYGISLNEALVKAEAARLGLINLSVDSLKVRDAQIGVEKATAEASVTLRGHSKNSAEAKDATAALERAKRAVADATRDEAKAIAEHGRGSAEASRASTVLRDRQLDLEKTTKASGEALRGHAEDSLEARDAQVKLEEAQRKLDDALAGDEQALDDNAKARATWSLITKQAGDVQGDWNRTNKEGVNAVRTFDETMKNFKATIGQTFGPILVRAVGFLTKLAEGFNSLPGPVRTVVGTVASFAITAGAIGLMGRALGGLVGAIPGMVRLAGVLRGVGAAGLLAAGPWILLGVLVAAAVYLIIRNWDAIKRVVSDAVAAIGRFMTRLRDGIWQKINEAFDFVTGLPRRILGVFADAGQWLLGAGKNIVIGLWNGIVGAWDWLVDQFKNLLGGIRDLLPFSPAKTGPFSGSGAPEYSGRAIATDLARGITSRTDGVRQAAARMAAAARPTMPALAVPGLGAIPAGVGAVGFGRTGSTPGRVSSERSAPPVVVNVAGSVISERDLVDVIDRSLAARQRRGGR